MRIGIDLGGTKIECVALAPDGSVLFRRRVPTPRDDYEATLGAISELIEDCERKTGQCGSVGIGHPGAVSPATGLIKNANSVWLNGRSLREDLENRLSRPLRLANDANCFALSEARDGAGADAEVVFGVIIGTGTGGGIVVRGRTLTGPNAIAGEWGHNPLPWPRRDELPGPACYCGRSGCIETFLSGAGLVNDHLRAGPGTGPQSRGTPPGTTSTAAPPTSSLSTIDAPEIIHLAAKGDVAAESTLCRYVERLARALASMINLLDPDIIVLGGGLSNLERLYHEVPRLWGRHVFSDRVSTLLRRARHGDASGVRGAAWLWDDPAHYTE